MPTRTKGNVTFRTFYTGKSWDYSVPGVRQTSMLYRTEREAASAARRAIKRLGERQDSNAKW